jgi:hypothetical protein
MTSELPDREERARAAALDAVLDKGQQAQRRTGLGGPVDDLADLAASLRGAMMPMPELPSGGRTEVRAAALAVQGAKRRGWAKLLVAAAVTLVVGALGGAALSGAVQQPSPTSDQAAVQVDLNYASGYLAKHNSAKASQYIERASKAILGRASAPLAANPSTATETAAIAVLKQDLAAQAERDAKLEAENAQLSKALGSMTRTAQAEVPVPATSSTTSTTTLSHPAVTSRITTASSATPPTTAAPKYTPPSSAAPTTGAPKTTANTTPPNTTPPNTTPPNTTPPNTTPPNTTPPTTGAHTTTAAPTSSPVPTVPVPTTKPPSRTRGIGPPVPLAQATTTVSATTTPPTGPVATTTTTTRPKSTTTTSGVAQPTTSASPTSTTLSTTTTTVPTTTTTDLLGTTTTSVATSTTTISP